MSRLTLLLLLPSVALSCGPEAPVNQPVAQSAPPDLPSSATPPPASSPSAQPLQQPGIHTSYVDPEEQCVAARKSYEALLFPQWDACIAHSKYKDILAVKLSIDKGGHIHDVSYTGGTGAGPKPASCAIDAARSTPFAELTCASHTLDVERSYLKSSTPVATTGHGAGSAAVTPDTSEEAFRLVCADPTCGGNLTMVRRWNDKNGKLTRWEIVDSSKCPHLAGLFYDADGKNGMILPLPFLPPGTPSERATVQMLHDKEIAGLTAGGDKSCEP